MSRLPQQPIEGASKAEYATWLGAFGQATKAFKVFPCEPNAKTPRQGFKWKEGASWDAKTIDAWWMDGEFNIGLAIQPGFVALDADIYKIGNDALLTTFEAEYGKLPETLEFESANGGRHFIYSTTRLLGNSTGTLPKFGDVRGFGGYIVGPGSSIDGKPYTVGFADPPVPLPPHVDARLVAKRSDTAAIKELPPTKMLDDPINIARYTVWLLTGASVGRMGTRNNTLAATAAMGASYGISEDETVHLILEHWNKRECPDAEPFDEEKLDKHARSGHNSSSSTFGNMALENPKLLGFTAVAGAATVATSGVFKRVSEFANVTPPARRWVVGTDADGWVVEDDITIEYGPGGIGKSIQSAQMCRDISRGEPVFGLLPCRRMPTLFIGCEDNEEEMHRRLHKLGVRDTDDMAVAYLGGQETVLHPPFKPGAAMGEDTPTFSLISHHLATMQAGPKFMVLDNLAHLFHGNYFDPGNISTFLNGYLRRWVRQFNVAILLLAHPSENQTTTGSGGYGGIGWSAGVRSRLYFEPHVVKSKEGKLTVTTRIGDQRVFSRKKSNYTREHRDGEGLILDWKDWSFVPVEKKATSLFTAVATEKEKPGVMSANKEAMIKIVWEAVTQALGAFINKDDWTGVSLSDDASWRMGLAGHEMVASTIRRDYLEILVNRNHPGWDNTLRRWRSPRASAQPPTSTAIN